MTRLCGITGRKVQTGNNVSHANNRTRRRFLPNLQNASFASEALGKVVKIRLSARAIRTIEKSNGLDAYLLNVPKARLSGEILQLKKRIQKAIDSKKTA